MKIENKVWADRIILKIDPSFKYRWEVFNELLCANLSQNTLWVDLGCGDNRVVEEFGGRTNYAIGIDLILLEHKTTIPFIRADLRDLPLRSGIVDFVSLRFVAEHLQNIKKCFSEIERILKPGGRVLVMTTNPLSPFIILSRLLPFGLKSTLIRTLFNVEKATVYPTFHRFSMLASVSGNICNLKLVYIDYLQDVNYVRRWLFLIFFFWHMLTRIRALRCLRNITVAVFQK